MVKKKTWNEFRDTGLFWFINQMLHTFGWAIVVDIEDGDVVDAYPARVKFRGFGEESQTNGYKKITKYMSDNVKDLLEEVK